jgi:uncharacterized protein (TIGR02147 family)
MNDIYAYSDYRAFLRDAYRERKAADHRFSYQLIARRMGFRSKSHFPQIVQGKLRLSGDQVWRMAELLKLKKREAEYFELLVGFTDAVTPREKLRYYERMAACGDVAPKVLDRDQFEFYERWYYAAVWNILLFYPFDGAFDKLARMVDPAISAGEARKAVKVLLRLGLIDRDESGIYRSCASIMRGTSEGYSLALANYASQMMDRAKHAIEATPKEERCISCVGLSVSEEAFARIQEEVREFRRRVLQIAHGSKKPSRAYHLNIQVFPISRSYHPEKGAGRPL